MGNRLAFSLLTLVLAGAANAGTQSQPRRSIPTIAKSANGAVVSIIMSDKQGNTVVQGSGFFASKEGLVVTNYHVIKEGNSAVIKLPDGTSYGVDSVLAFDKKRDLAIIKAHGENFPSLNLGDSDHIEVGQEVVAIGNPLALESTVSDGIISGIRRDEELGGRFLQITAPISPGSSGGPLFAMNGNVIGITSGYLKTGENLNFAIPINDVKGLLVESGALATELSGKYSCDTGAPLAQHYTVSVSGPLLTLLISLNGKTPVGEMFLHREGKIWLSGKTGVSESKPYDFEEPTPGFSITRSKTFFLVNAWAYDASRGKIVIGQKTEGWPEYLPISGTCKTTSH